MTEKELYQKLTQALVKGREPTALRLTREGLAQGLDPIEIINKGFQPGLDVIGKEYETGACFVPELVMVGRIMQSVMRILDSELKRQSEPRPTIGKVVLATVAGDVHTIGKDMVGTMLNLHGFEVIDMGFNVPVATIIEKLQETGSPILGLSALLTTTRHAQREIIRALETADIRKRVKVIIGGAATSQEWANRIGADSYAENAVQAVARCKQMLDVA